MTLANPPYYGIFQKNFLIFFNPFLITPFLFFGLIDEINEVTEEFFELNLIIFCFVTQKRTCIGGFLSLSILSIAAENK